MLVRQALLPPQANRFEIALSETMDRTPELLPGLTALRDLKDTPPPSAVPFLIKEYGLEEIVEFFPIAALAIEPGLKWRRLIGTLEAVRMALVWIGYRAAMEDQWIGRRRWHTFQFRFPELPGADVPDLARVAKIADISTPFRSRFRRGVFAYDVGALDADTARLDSAILDHESGHALTEGGPLWSFGRTHRIDHTYTEADGLALGNWIEPSGAAPLRWMDMDFPWEAANFPWDAEGATQRRVALAAWFAGRTIHMRLKDSTGAVIGFRRCRAAQAVRAKADGPYAFGAETFEPAASGETLYVEAQTDFGLTGAKTATSAALIVGGVPAPGIKPGRLWLGPNDLTGGTAFAERPVTIPLRPTVRDQIKFLVRF